jgi:hypothetical protein
LKNNIQPWFFDRSSSSLIFFSFFQCLAQHCSALAVKQQLTSVLSFLPNVGNYCSERTHRAAAAAAATVAH